MTQYNIDENRRRIVITAKTADRTPTVAETVLQIIGRRPDLGRWEWIFDIREPHEKATTEQLDQITEVFNVVCGEHSCTIFVSSDPETYARCALMDLKFIDRRHIVAPTMKEGEALIPRVVPSVYRRKGAMVGLSQDGASALWLGAVRLTCAAHR
ncbi:hypothetical protein [Brevundimonas sp. MEB006b]|uniref:hypothetical protein n=1 Tax=Brevundimonas sp. MEB006b TaxID=3040283 RepID=UPI002551B4F1|nr:hypothetical protein [Brevundimonas sp. MEB006b]